MKYFLFIFLIGSSCSVSTDFACASSDDNPSATCENGIWIANTVSTVNDAGDDSVSDTSADVGGVDLGTDVLAGDADASCVPESSDIFCKIADAMCGAVAGDNCGDVVVDCGECAGVSRCDDQNRCVCDGPALCVDANQACGEILLPTECPTSSFECGACPGTSTCDAGACGCEDGYEFSGVDCDDVNECVSGTSDCDVNAVCNNTPGLFECACNSGFVGDGKACDVAVIALDGVSGLAGVQRFDLNDDQILDFETVVEDGWILVARDFGNGAGPLPETTLLSVDVRGILSAQVLATLTAATEVRISTSTGNVDKQTLSADVLSRVLAQEPLGRGQVDDALNSTWFGAGRFGAGNCSSSDVSLAVTIFHACGNARGFHWIPSGNQQREEYRDGEMDDQDVLSLWVRQN